jgi:hypothetical protein
VQFWTDVVGGGYIGGADAEGDGQLCLSKIRVRGGVAGCRWGGGLGRLAGRVESEQGTKGCVIRPRAKEVGAASWELDWEGGTVTAGVALDTGGGVTFIRQPKVERNWVVIKKY